MQTQQIENVKLKVVGVTFANPDGTSRQEIMSNLVEGSSVFLEREPNNKFDKNAVKVNTLLGQVGYLGRDYAAILSGMMDTGHIFTATIAELDTYKGNWFMQININEV